MMSRSRTRSSGSSFIPLRPLSWRSLWNVHLSCGAVGDKKGEVGEWWVVIVEGGGAGDGLWCGFFVLYVIKDANEVAPLLTRRHHERWNVCGLIKSTEKWLPKPSSTTLLGQAC